MDSCEFTWEGAAGRMERMTAANRRATVRWLRSLTIEKSVRIFEDLCEGIPELDSQRLPDAPPVALFKLWRN